MTKNYNIFGKLVKVFSYDNPTIKKMIIDHFCLYEELEDVKNPDLVINVLKEDLNKKFFAINPKIHYEVKSGFKTIIPKISVEYKTGEHLVANIVLQQQDLGLISYLKKLYNIQYSSIEERIAQIIYELILVPSIYFNPDQFLIHSSAFKKSNAGAVLIGGTGGVGKTSLEIELCMNRSYSFIADDISVVTDDGYIWPNLSFPKIYAYNLKDNKILSDYIFKNRTFHDKLAWKLKLFLNGPSGVRRTVSPVDAYGKHEKGKSKIDTYYILVKKDVKDISIEKVDARKAAEMTLFIMQTEYSVFNNHVLWHEFNCEALNVEPILNLQDVFARWKKKSEVVLKKIDCYIVSVPLKIEHKEFTKRVADMIEQNPTNAL